MGRFSAKSRAPWLKAELDTNNPFANLVWFEGFSRNYGTRISSIGLGQSQKSENGRQFFCVLRILLGVSLPMISQPESTALPS